MNFGAHKLVHSEPFLDSRCEIWKKWEKNWRKNDGNCIKIDSWTVTQ